MKRVVLVISLLTFLMVLLCECTGPVAGSETTNGFTVAVKNGEVSGKTVPGGEVMCFSGSYDPDSLIGYADTVRADAQGRFSFGKLASMDYNIFTVGTGGDSCALIQYINPDKQIDTTVDFRGVMSIHGMTVYSSQPVPGAHVAVLGTPYLTLSGAEGEFSFVSVPDGTFTVKSVAYDRGVKGELAGSKVVSRESNWNGALIIEMN